MLDLVDLLVLFAMHRIVQMPIELSIVVTLIGFGVSEIVGDRAWVLFGRAVVCVWRRRSDFVEFDEFVFDNVFMILDSCS